MLFVSLVAAIGCGRDFSRTEPFNTPFELDARADVTHDAGAPDHRYLDLGALVTDGCLPTIEDDAAPPTAPQGCSVESDWLCGSRCGETSRLLCLEGGATGKLLREIRCRDDGHCFCGIGGVFTPCYNENNRVGCIAARSAFRQGCCTVTK